MILFRYMGTCTASTFHRLRQANTPTAARGAKPAILVSRHHRAVIQLVYFAFSYHPPSNVFQRLSTGHDTPSTDLVVGVTSKQGLTIGGPGEGDTLWLAGLATTLHEVRAELVNLALLLEVKDDNLLGGGSAQPVAVRREDKRVDLVTGGERVQVLGLVQVPKHGGTILATGSAERTIWRDGDSVDVSGVADVVGLQAAGGELPDLGLKSAESGKINARKGSARAGGDQCAGEGKVMFHSPRWGL